MNTTPRRCAVCQRPHAAGVACDGRALQPGEYWVQCPDGSWTVARVLNWWHAKNRTKAVQEQ